MHIHKTRTFNVYTIHTYAYCVAPNFRGLKNFVNYFWIMKILFTKTQKFPWLVDKEVCLALTFTKFRKLHEDLLSRQNSMNHKNFRPRKFEATCMVHARTHTRTHAHTHKVENTHTSCGRSLKHSMH